MNGEMGLSNVYSKMLGKISMVFTMKGTAERLTVKIRQTTRIITQENYTAYGLKTHTCS